MSYRHLPSQVRAERWMDQREIQNLMGKFVYDMMLKREDKFYEKYWCKQSAEPSLGLNNGYYVGEEAIRGYYMAQFENTEERSEHMRKMFPDYLSKYSRIELHGVGSLDIDALTSPVVVVSDDGRTAQGIWCVMGIENNIFPNGPYSMLGYGYICGDFVKEEYDWRIWHLLQLDEIVSPVATDWSRDWTMPGPATEFEALGKLTLPKPNRPCMVYESYSTGRRPVPQLRIPQPYRTFAETFSYGYCGY